MIAELRLTDLLASERSERDTYRGNTIERQDLFSKQEKLINSLPPTQVSLAVHVLFLLDEFYLLLCFLPGTQDAYIEHTNGTLFQASIWETYLKKNQNIPLPEGFVWTQEEDWKPV